MSFLSFLPRLASRPLRTFTPTTLPPTTTTTTPSLLSRFFSSSPIPRFSTTPPREAITRKPTKIKLKTHKGAAKRWVAVSNGNYKRAKAGRVHLNSVLSPVRLNRLGEPAYARPIERKLLRRLMPYGQ